MKYILKNILEWMEKLSINYNIYFNIYFSFNFDFTNIN